jgi:hypothetical protein
MTEFVVTTMIGGKPMFIRCDEKYICNHNIQLTGCERVKGT